MKEHGKIEGTVRARREGRARSLAAPSQEYPIGPKEHGTDFLMDHRHLWLRSKRQHAILRVRHTIIKAVRDFFDGRGFTLVDAPDLHAERLRGHEQPLRDRLPRRARRTSRSPGSSTWRPAAAAFGQGRTASARRSARRRARRAGTSPSSGWSSRRSRSWTSTGDMRLAEDFISYVVGRALETRQRGAQGARARHDAPRAGERAVPAHHVRARRSSILQKNGHPEAKVGDDFGGDEETVICEPVRSARSSCTATRWS